MVVTCWFISIRAFEDVFSRHLLYWIWMNTKKSQCQNSSRLSKTNERSFLRRCGLVHILLTKHEGCIFTVDCRRINLIRLSGGIGHVRTLTSVYISFLLLRQYYVVNTMYIQSYIRAFKPFLLWKCVTMC